MSPNLKFFLRGGVFLLLLLVVYGAIEPILIEPFGSEVMAAEVLLTEARYDILILGSSHAYCAFDPAIIDDIVEGITTVSLSTPLMTPVQSYHLLKYALASGQTPRLVVIEPSMARARINGISQYLFYNYFSGTRQLQQLTGILHFYQADNYLKLLLPFIYQHENWKDKEMIQRNLSNYWDIEEYARESIRDDLGYQRKGYRPVSRIIDPDAYQEALNDTLDPDLRPENIEALQQIIALSKEYGFELVFVIAPFPTDPDGSEYEKIYKLLDDLGAVNYNFNSIDSLSLTPLSFFDKTHLNANGAVAASLSLAQVIADHLNLVEDIDERQQYQGMVMQSLTTEFQDGDLLLTLQPGDPDLSLQYHWQVVGRNGESYAEDTETATILIPRAFLDLNALRIDVEIKHKNLPYVYQLTILPANLTFADDQ